MAWVKVDDGFADHPKFLRVGPLGIALWLAGLCYCNRHLTNGYIPKGKISTLLSWEFQGLETVRDGERVTPLLTIGHGGGMSGEDTDSEFVAQLLVEAGLWDEGPDGYEMHDYLDYQRSREDIVSTREQTRTRVAKHRASAQISNGVTPVDSNGVSNALVREIRSRSRSRSKKEEKEKASRRLARKRAPSVPVEDPGLVKGLVNGLASRLSLEPPPFPKDEAWEWLTKEARPRDPREAMKFMGWAWKEGTRDLEVIKGWVLEIRQGGISDPYAYFHPAGDTVATRRDENSLALGEAESESHKAAERAFLGQKAKC